MPTNSVKATAAPIARPDASGTRTGASPSSAGSAIHTLTMIRRYKKAAMTDDTMAMIASA